MEMAVLVNTGRTDKAYWKLCWGDQRGAAQGPFLALQFGCGFILSKSEQARQCKSGQLHGELDFQNSHLAYTNKEKNLNMRNSPKKVLPGGITGNITAT